MHTHTHTQAYTLLIVCFELTFNLDVNHENPPLIYRQNNEGTQNHRNIAKGLIRGVRLNFGMIGTLRFPSHNNLQAKDEVEDKSSQTAAF